MPAAALSRAACGTLRGQRTWARTEVSMRENREVRVSRTQKEADVCHNPAEAERDRADRDDRLERIEAELARIEALRERDRRQRKTKTRGTSASRSARQAKTERTLARNQDKAHSKAECALRDHPTLGR
jgi:hypothetical protein